MASGIQQARISGQPAATSAAISNLRLKNPSPSLGTGEGSRGATLLRLEDSFHRSLPLNKNLAGDGEKIVKGQPHFVEYVYRINKPSVKYTLFLGNGGSSGSGYSTYRRYFALQL
jgi:hypothetical protein